MRRCHGFRVMLVGAPGTGKGHISDLIVKIYGAVHISPGNILRNHIRRQTELGQKVKTMTKQGILVPDHLVADIMAKAIRRAENYNIVLDGYPRNVDQARHLDNLLKLDLVIHLNLPYKAIMKKLSSRLVHVRSGRVYNDGDAAPMVPGLDDVTGEPLERRPDDRPHVVLTRLSDAERYILPVVWYYNQFDIVHTISASKHEKLWPRLETYLKRRWRKFNVFNFSPETNINLIN